MVCALQIQGGEDSVLRYLINNILHSRKGIAIQQGKFIYSLTIIDAHAFLVVFVSGDHHLSTPGRIAALNNAFRKKSFGFH